MSDIVDVRFPVPYRYLQRRSRKERFGFGDGVVPVELRHVAERPREALRTGATRVLAAEGAAWTVLRHAGGNVGPDDLKGYLASAAVPRGPAGEALEAWALRSPICMYDGMDRGRGGDVVPGRDVTLTLDGREEASRDVAAFLDDRVRIHGDRVLVREERLVGVLDVWRSRPRAFLADPPRGKGGYLHRDMALATVRPDRLARLWEAQDRARKGPVPTGDWDAISGIPPELLRDDDVAWLANRLPAMLVEVGKAIPQGLAATAANAHDRSAASLCGMMPGLERLRERGLTHSVSGDRVAPALDLVRDALEAAIGMERGYRDMYGVKGERPALRTYEFLARLVDEELLPRLRGVPGTVEEDVEALSLLPVR